MSEKLAGNNTGGQRIQSSAENPLRETPTPSAINRHWAAGVGDIVFEVTGLPCANGL
jgi:hypothetical protein